MATEESDVKNYLRKELRRLSGIAQVPIKVVANPASAMSEIGRADCDIIINRVWYIHAEIKKAALTYEPAQLIVAEEEGSGFIQVCIAGRVGVDDFIEQLPRALSVLIADYRILQRQTLRALNDSISDYISDKDKRARAAAKRPERQSKRVSKGVRQNRKTTR